MRKTSAEMEELLGRVTEQMDAGSKFPGMSYEEGIDAALRWALERRTTTRWRSRMRTAADVPTTRVQPMEPVAPYGMELVVDLHDCDHLLFTRQAIERFILRVCEISDMQRGPLHFWDYEGHPTLKARAAPHLKGTTAVQFLYTSNLTIHTLDDLHRVYINLFSCREFAPGDIVAYSAAFFGAGWCGHHVFERS